MRFQLASRIVVALIALLVIPAGYAQTLKIATIAPEGSSWMNDMRAGAKAIEKKIPKAA